MTVQAVVYTKHDCVICSKAQNVLLRLGVPFDLFYVDDDAERMASCSYDGIGLDTIPVVRVYNEAGVEVRRWVNDDILGGFSIKVQAAISEGWTFQEWCPECPQIKPKE